MSEGPGKPKAKKETTTVPKGASSLGEGVIDYNAIKSIGSPTLGEGAYEEMTADFKASSFLHTMEDMEERDRIDSLEGKEKPPIPEAKKESPPEAKKKSDAQTKNAHKHTEKCVISRDAIIIEYHIIYTKGTPATEGKPATAGATSDGRYARG